MKKYRLYHKSVYYYGQQLIPILSANSILTNITCDRENRTTMDPDYDAEEVVEVIEIDDNEPISDDDAGDEGLNLHFRKKRNLQMSYSYERQYELCQLSDVTVANHY